MVPNPDLSIWKATHGHKADSEDTAMAGMESSVERNGSIGNDGFGDLENELHTRKAFKTLIYLRGHLNSIYREAYGQSTRQNTQQKTKTATTGLKLQFADASFSQPTIVAKQKDIVTARAHFAYWEARSYGVLSSLVQPRQQGDMAETAEAVRCITETIRAFHGTDNNCLMLPNAFGAIMAYVMSPRFCEEAKHCANLVQDNAAICFSSTLYRAHCRLW